MMNQGVYDISSREYHESEGISRSAIMEFRKTPLHFWHKYIDPEPEPEKETPAKIFGSAVHTMILENHEFYNRYAVKPADKIVLPKMPLLKEVGRDAYDQAKKIRASLSAQKEIQDQEFEEMSRDKIILSNEDYEKISEMHRQIKNTPQVREILTGGQVEKSIFWIDPETTLLCKARPDIWHDNFIVDYKTTKDASESAFQRDLYYYGYYLQAAMIKEGLKHALGIEMENFIYVPQEKEEPYLPAIYQLDEAAIDYGIDEFHSLLRDIKACIDAKEFPGYETKLISLPAWVK